jgi:hypothetical protein
MILLKQLLLSFVIFTFTYGQIQHDDWDIIKLNINTLLSSYDDGEYKLYDMIDVDSSYSNLRDCYIFIAFSPEQYDPHEMFITGVYKNNQILWTSEPIETWAPSGFVYPAIDLTNDGQAEIIIIIEWGRGLTTGEDWLIFSWDGVTGRMINDVDENGYTKLLLSAESYRLMDLDGNGTIEIVGSSRYGEKKEVTFSWNGVAFGDWQDGPQKDNFYYLPMNKFSASINAKVIKSANDTLYYYYSVSNDLNSSQNIKKIWLKIDVDSLYASFATVDKDWLVGGNHEEMLQVFQENIFPEGATKEKLLSGEMNFLSPAGIAPGDSVSGLYVHYVSLPIISNYYLQSDSKKINSADDPALQHQIFIQNLYDNSVSGKTVVPIKIPHPLIPLDFLDSLKNYNSQSYGLGWVQTQETRDKYNNYFTNAKNYLNQNNTAATKSELQLVLNECNTDSSTVLTSEAYALLYFNTEYLIEQIPDTEPGLPVKLKDSQGNLLQGGSLQYYEGSWKDAVNNNNGTFNVITERTTVSIRMTYEGGSQQLNNVVVGPDTVAFQTVNTTVQLLNSQGNLITADETVQYYAGSWREFGSIVNGVAAKELLPKQYSFRMTYGGANNDKQQDIGTDPVVVFQTVNAAVQLLSSQGNLITADETVQYYAGSWREFGTTVSGTVSKELLPKSYSFRITHEGVSNDKQQDIGVENTVSFSTVLCVVHVNDSQNQPVDGAEVKYYSGSWRDIGITANGEVSKELLPKNLSFRVIYNGVTQNKQQDPSLPILVREKN